VLISQASSILDGLFDKEVIEKANVDLGSGKGYSFDDDAIAMGCF
jgi:hypothetical protein